MEILPEECTRFLVVFHHLFQIYETVRLNAYLLLQVPEGSPEFLWLGEATFNIIAPDGVHAEELLKFLIRIVYKMGIGNYRKPFLIYRILLFHGYLLLLVQRYKDWFEDW